MLPITKKYTNCTISNRGGRKIEWIVMHYFGGLSTALECAGWFCNPSNNSGSADFCVDDTHIVQVNPDIRKYYTWHCGGGLQGAIRHSKYGICMNGNSIGIEMRPYNDNGAVSAAQNAGWYFHDKTVQNAVDLVKYLMKEYNIDADHVIMHADVTGKYCPAPWLDRPQEWDAFQKAIRGEEVKEPAKEPTKETLAVDGYWGTKLTTRLQKIFGTTADGIISNQWLCYRDENPGLLGGTFEWHKKPNGKGSQLIKAMQKWAGMRSWEQDGEIGTKTIKALQKKLGTPVDGCVSAPSMMVKALQKWANSQK